MEKLTQQQVWEILHEYQIKDSKTAYSDMHLDFLDEFWVLSIYLSGINQWVMSVRLPYVQDIPRFKELFADLLLSIKSYEENTVTP